MGCKRGDVCDDIARALMAHRRRTPAYYACAQKRKKWLAYGAAAAFLGSIAVMSYLQIRSEMPRAGQ